MGWGGGAAATGGGGAVLCIHLANQMQEGYIGARHFQTGQIRGRILQQYLAKVTLDPS